MVVATRLISMNTATYCEPVFTYLSPIGRSYRSLMAWAFTWLNHFPKPLNIDQQEFSYKFIILIKNKIVNKEAEK